MSDRLMRVTGRRVTGRVKWFNDAKGYGFVTTDDGHDAFVHHSEIDKGARGFKTLHEDDRVQFDLVSAPRGYQATAVVVLERSAIDDAPPS